MTFDFAQHPAVTDNNDGTFTATNTDGQVWLITRVGYSTVTGEPHFAADPAGYDWHNGGHHYGGSFYTVCVNILGAQR